MEWLGGRVTDVYMTVSATKPWMHGGCGYRGGAVAIGNGRDPSGIRPDPAVRARVRARWGCQRIGVVVIAVSRLVRHKGYPELLTAMHGLDAELWVIGERLASDHGEDLEPYFSGLALAIGCGGWLSRGCAGFCWRRRIFSRCVTFRGLPMSASRLCCRGCRWWRRR